MRHSLRILNRAFVFALFSQLIVSNPPARAEERIAGELRYGVKAGDGSAQQAPKAPTQSTTTLTRKRAIELALANNPAIRAAQAQLDEARAEILTAKTRNNPSFVTDLGFIAERTYRVGGLSYVFDPPGKRHLRIAVAEDEYAVRKAEAKRVAGRIYQEVFDAHANWLTALLRLRLETENARRWHEIETLAGQQGEKLAEPEATHARMLAAQSKAKADAADTELRTARARLASLIGERDFEAPENFEEGPELPSAIRQQSTLDALLKAAFDERHDLAANLAASRVEEDCARLLRRSRIPALNLTGGFDMVSPDGNKYVAGFYTIGTFELPVFNRQQGPLAQSAMAGRRLKLEREEIERKIREETETGFLRFQGKSAQWARYRQELLPMADEIDRRALERFRTGDSTLADVIGWRKDVEEIRDEAATAFDDCQHALINLQAALNETLPASDGSDENGATPVSEMKAFKMNERTNTSDEAFSKGKDARGKP